MTSTDALKGTEDSVVREALSMVRTSAWAASRYQSFDLATVRGIVRAAGEAAYEASERLARAAVDETGFGVVADKTFKNRAASRDVLEQYGAEDYVSPVISADDKVVRIPVPAGVVFALTPSTNPVSTAYFKVLIALLTRNAILVSPHPAAAGCTTEAVELMRAAAQKAGAPEGLVQVLAHPSLPVIDEVMRDPRVAVTVATGGSAMVRAAYSSGNPAIGVGPGNPPVIVDETADLREAMRITSEGKAFDHSVLCSSESVLITVNASQHELPRAMAESRMYLCTPDEVARIRRYLFPYDRLDPRVVGRSAEVIARETGLRIGNAQVIATPVETVHETELLAHEKLCPVLAHFVARDFAHAVDAAVDVLEVTGVGHSAGLFTEIPDRVAELAARAKVLRLVVNSSTSTGVGGMTTNLPVTMTVGTGFMGKSSLGENLTPRHLVNHQAIAYGRSAPFRWADATGAPVREQHGSTGSGSEPTQDELRRIVLEELKTVMGHR